MHEWWWKWSMQTHVINRNCFTPCIQLPVSWLAWSAASRPSNVHYLPRTWSFACHVAHFKLQMQQCQLSEPSFPRQIAMNAILPVMNILNGIVWYEFISYWLLSGLQNSRLWSSKWCNRELLVSVAAVIPQSYCILTGWLVEQLLLIRAHKIPSCMESQHTSSW